jgi:hypothetical protein
MISGLYIGTSLGLGSSTRNLALIRIGWTFLWEDFAAVYYGGRRKETVSFSWFWTEVACARKWSVVLKDLRGWTELIHAPQAIQRFSYLEVQPRA